MKNDIGRLLKRISCNIKTRADAQLNQYGLTLSQVHVLRCIEASGGETTQKALEQKLEVSHPTIVGLIARLEKNGYVVCRAGTAKERSKRVAVTEKGREQKKQIERHRQRTDQLLLKGLSQEETGTLRHLLEVLVQNTEKEAFAIDSANEGIGEIHSGL